MRILDVEVVAAGLDLVGRDHPGAGRFLAAQAIGPAPPVDAGVEVFELDRTGHGIGLLALRHGLFVEPDVAGRLAFFKEQQVGPDRGVGAEDGVGQAHDGVQVALLHQMLLEAGLHAFAEQGAVGQHHGGAAVLLQQADDQGEEQVGGLAGLELLGEVGFDAVFLAAAERRVR